ncbi:MAG: sigma-54-dependent Fis family transcriptional regulator [Rhodothermales bacterium]|nr:sigma-54-dependent Fis family transcriptional regulator [Rhodothermales bacterium]MBO6778384.1 sigma-54-dependent Fis family transcriptional regulator [Rhodothermales bacterium]
MKYRIFVVDDDRHYARMLSYRLDKNPQYEVETFSSGEELLRNMVKNPDLILCDIMMPGIDGIEVLRRIVSRRPNLPIIMVSAQGVVETAVEAMRIGAYDYITKGQDDLSKLDAIVKNCLDKVKLEREVSTLREEVSQKYSVRGLIGESPAMQKVYKMIQKALRGDLTVAIQGESGTGKELVAKAIHYGSTRKRGPFVVVNCAAIPRDLMESEFFGHEKGSFTGAHARKIGKFEQADGGTIFLDEIGELDLDLQAKLLRALQEGELTRVGGNETINFDARVISATNKNVVEMIRDNKFREDLYYRLFQYPIPLPPLRERGQDVIVLTNYFLKEYTKAHQEFKGKRFSKAARHAIATFSWPGNVRELKSAVERAILLSDAEEISAADLMLGNGGAVSPWADRMSLAEAAETQFVTPDFDEDGVPAEGDGPTVSGISLGADSDHIVSLEDLKRRAVERAYRLCDGNVDRAAVELGIGRATMYRLLKKYHMMS